MHEQQATVRTQPFKLNYNDEIVVKKEDLDTLAPKTWLNDTIIVFGLQYYVDTLLSEEKRRQVLVVPPTTLLLLRFSGREFGRETAVQMELHKRKMLLLPVNDNKDPDRAGGGSHWSLLVYRPNKPFLHFDSKGNSNEHVAEELADLILSILPPHFDNRSEANFEHKYDGELPQQANSWDCGLFAIEYGRRVTECFNRDGDSLDRLTFDGVERQIDRVDFQQQIINLSYNAKYANM